MNETANPILDLYGRQKIAEYTQIRDQQKRLLDSQASIRGGEVSAAELVEKMVAQNVPRDAAEVLVSFIL